MMLSEQNKQDLRDTLDRVLAADTEERWVQEEWFTPIGENWGSEPTCNTAGCFAGWRAMMDMPEVKIDIHDRMVDGVPIQEWARARLGLDYPSAKVLFNGDNSLVDLKAIVDRLCADQPLDLVFLQSLALHS